MSDTAVQERRKDLLGEPTGPPGRDRFFLGMAILMIALNVVGFAPSYFLKSFFDTPELPVRIHLHGALFTSWFVLFFIQTLLVASFKFSSVLSPDDQEKFANYPSAVTPWSQWTFLHKFARAREVISAAEVLYFLGFGFHERSVRRLGDFLDLDFAKGLQVSGTHDGFTPPAWERTRDELFPHGWTDLNGWNSVIQFVKYNQI